MKNDFKGYSRNLLFSVIITIVITCAAFITIYSAGHKVIDEYVKSSSYIYNSQTPYIESFQKYVSDNKISSDDYDYIDKWVKQENLDYLIIADNSGIQYVSTDFCNFNNPDNFSLTFSEIPTYYRSVNFNNTTAKLFIYIDKSQMYLSKLFFADAIISIILGIVIIYFIAHRTLIHMYNNLHIVEQSELELIKEKNSLIRSMAHDIRTPLTGLQSYAEIIKMDNYNGNIPSDHIDVIFSKISEIKNLTDQLFDYSLANNEEDFELDAPTNIEFAIGDYLSEMAYILQENGFKVNIESLCWKDISIIINANFLGRIFNNITNNICKYADKSKPVYIRSIYRNKDVGIEISNYIADKSSLFNTTGMGIRNITIMMKRMNGRAIVSHNSNEYRIVLWFSHS